MRCRGSGADIDGGADGNEVPDFVDFLIGDQAGPGSVKLASYL